jgi:hypothetical protein
MNFYKYELLQIIVIRTMCYYIYSGYNKKKKKKLKKKKKNILYRIIVFNTTYRNFHSFNLIL